MSKPPSQAKTPKTASPVPLATARAPPTPTKTPKASSPVATARTGTQSTVSTARSSSSISMASTQCTSVAPTVPRSPKTDSPGITTHTPPSAASSCYESDAESVSCCEACPAASMMFTEPIDNTKFELSKDGFFFDKGEGDMTIDQYAGQLSAANVYRLFFRYTLVIQRDQRRCASSFYKYEMYNRFLDIPCIEANRVKVPCSDGHDYIHANYVDGYRQLRKFIICQAPLQRTVEQFWAMTWTNKSCIVVSMIPLDDDSCPVYIPANSGEKKCYGPYEVENTGVVNVRNNYDATCLVLCDKESGQKRRILHFIYNNWPDKGTPTYPSELLKFIADINHNQAILKQLAIEAKWAKKEDHCPIIMHCLAGAGRSTNVAVIDIICRKLDETGENGKTAMINVDDTILRIRTLRCMAVQKPEQYIFIHLIVLEYALRRRFLNLNENDLDLSSFQLKTGKAK